MKKLSNAEKDETKTTETMNSSKWLHWWILPNIKREININLPETPPKIRNPQQDATKINPTTY